MCANTYGCGCDPALIHTLSIPLCAYPSLTVDILIGHLNVCTVHLSRSAPLCATPPSDTLFHATTGIRCTIRVVRHSPPLHPAGDRYSTSTSERCRVTIGTTRRWRRQMAPKNTRAWVTWTSRKSSQWRRTCCEQETAHISVAAQHAQTVIRARAWAPTRHVCYERSSDGTYAQRSIMENCYDVCGVIVL